MPLGTAPGDTLRISIVFISSTSSLPATTSSLDFNCAGIASRFDLLRVTFPACTPNQAPRFDLIRQVAPDDSRHLIATLTNIRTRSVTRFEDPNAQDGGDGRGPVPGDRVEDGEISYYAFARIHTLLTPADTGPNDTLTLNTLWVSLVDQPTIYSTISYNCGTGWNGGHPTTPIHQMYFPGGCFKPVTVFVPKGPKGPDHYETQQEAAACQPINQNAMANVALYCQDGNLTVYAINNAAGYFAFALSKEVLASFPADLHKNALIREALGARLYRLSNGNLQINRVTSDPGKEYVFIWGGC